MKKVGSWLVVAMAIFALVSFTACGDDDNGKKTDDDVTDQIGDDDGDGDGDDIGRGLMKECNPTIEVQQCQEDLECLDILDTGSRRCYAECSGSGNPYDSTAVMAQECPTGYECLLAVGDTSAWQGVCLPSCSAASDCDDYESTFCQWMDANVPDITVCADSIGEGNWPCDASNPCQESDDYGYLYCANVPEFDSINNVCAYACGQMLTGLPADSLEAMCDLFSSAYHCQAYPVGSSQPEAYVCMPMECNDAWGTDAGCNEGDTCQPMSDGTNYCTSGGTAGFGEECSQMNPLLGVFYSDEVEAQLIDPLCGTNLQCGGTEYMYGQDGICMEKCVADGSLTCTQDLPDVGGDVATTCIYSDQDYITNEIGICGISCTGTFSYSDTDGNGFNLWDITTQTDTCNDSSTYEYCHLYSGTYNSAENTGEISLGYCGYSVLD